MAPSPLYSYHPLSCTIPSGWLQKQPEIQNCTISSGERARSPPRVAWSRIRALFPILPLVAAVQSPTASNLRTQPDLGAPEQYPYHLNDCASTSMPHSQCPGDQNQEGSNFQIYHYLSLKNLFPCSHRVAIKDKEVGSVV